MPWVKLDDQFADHPKIVACGPLASWLYVCGLGYCCRLLTDGFIPEGQVRKLADVEDAKGLAEKLVEVNLWERCDGGYRVHDYHDYQPTREKALAIREARAEAGSRGGKQKASNLLEVSQGDARPFAKQNSTPYPSRTRTHPDPIQEAETHVSAGADAPPAARVAPPQKAPRVVKHPLPADFPLTAARRAWLQEHRPDLDAEMAHDEFCTYWRSIRLEEKGKKTDWDLTWQNGMLRSRMVRAPARASPNGYHKPSATEGFAAIAERLRREESHEPSDFPGAIDVPFSVGAAQRRHPSRGA